MESSVQPLVGLAVNPEGVGSDGEGSVAPGLELGPIQREEGWSLRSGGCGRECVGGGGQ